MRKKILLGVVALSFLITPLLYRTAGAQTGLFVPVFFRYPVKFVCGTMGSPDVDWPLARGRYHTAINVHNPVIAGKVTFAKKVVVTSSGVWEDHTPAQTPGLATPFFRTELEANNGYEIDCPEISFVTGVPISGFEELGGASYVKGFVVIMSLVELDVTAVYTARKTDSQAESKHVETVRPRIQPAFILALPFLNNNLR
jgi:hypothetical protein